MNDSTFHTFDLTVDPDIRFARSGYKAEEPNSMRIGSNSILYMGDDKFVTMYRDMTRYGIDKGLLCPQHPDDCEMKQTDCCGVRMWECETHIVMDRQSGDTYRECRDPKECGLYDRDTPSLAEHADGDGR